MRKTDIASVIPIYLDYYNNCEDGCWTIEKAQRRIKQVVCMEDAYSLILENEGNVIGFAMGYFKQYDDIIGYTLVYCIVDICQNSAEQSFSGKAPERGDAVASLSEGNAVRWKPGQGGLAEYE